MAVAEPPTERTVTRFALLVEGALAAVAALLGLHFDLWSTDAITSLHVHDWLWAVLVGTAASLPMGSMVLVVELAPENIANAFQALKELEYNPRVPVTPQQFADPDQRAQWIKEKLLDF